MDGKDTMKYAIFSKFNDKTQEFEYRVLERSNNLWYNVLFGVKDHDNPFFNSVQELCDVYSGRIPSDTGVSYNYDIDKGACIIECDDLKELRGVIAEKYPEELI